MHTLALYVAGASGAGQAVYGDGTGTYDGSACCRILVLKHRSLSTLTLGEPTVHPTAPPNILSEFVYPFFWNVFTSRCLMAV